MKMLRILIFGVVALAQLAVPATMVWQRDQTLKQGRIWKFRTAPVDPVDVIRGRYIALRFTAEEFAAPAKFEAGNKPVYAVLKQSTDGFAEIDHLTTEAAGTDDAVPVESVWWWGGKQQVRFPFNKFWVAEANAALDQLYIDNRPLSEYPRAHSPQ